jgi:hypothetical protein
MTGDIEAAVAATRRELMEPRATLFAVQRASGKNVREQTLRAYGRLIDAHFLITGLLAAALLRINGKLVPINPTLQGSNALFASFVIGIEICENAIAEGRYLQALALLRQEMETVARIKTIRAGRRRNGKQCSNMAALGDPSLARLGGELSEAAHVSKHIVRSTTEYEVGGEELPGPTSGTRYFPAFDEGLARRCFSLHLVLAIELVCEFTLYLKDQYSDGVTESALEAVNLAMQLMQAEGMIEVSKLATFERLNEA